MKILRSYVCRPSDVLGAAKVDGILKFTMSTAGCWKLYDWAEVGEAEFRQEAEIVDNATLNISQFFSVAVGRDEAVEALKIFNDICGLYAAHFADDGRVFFQGFESVGAADKLITSSARMTTRGQYHAYREVGAGSCLVGVFAIDGVARSLATIITAGYAVTQEQFLKTV